MLTALRRWVAAAPGSPARVSRHGDELRFQSCDPGKAANVGNDASERALEMVAVRTAIGTTILRSGAPEKPSRCLAGKLIDTFPLRKLENPRFGTHSLTIQAHVRRLAASCR